MSEIRRGLQWVTAHPVLTYFVFFAIFPFILPYKALATQMLIFGLFALGFNLLYGYTGSCRSGTPRTTGSARTGRASRWPGSAWARSGSASSRGWSRRASAG